MSRTRAFLRNASWSLALQLVTIVSGFIVPRLIIGAYGSQMNGLVTSLTQMINYIALVEAGISAAAVFALYKPLADGDNEQVSAIVSAAKKFYYKSGAIFAALALLLAIAYPMLVTCEGLTSLQVAVLVMALCASGFLDFFTLAKYRVLLTASQRNWVIQAASITYRVLYIIVVVIMTGLGVRLEIVYVAAILPILARTVFLVIYTRRKYPQVDFDADDQGIKLDQRWDAFYFQVIGVLQSGFPVLVATFIIGDLSILSVYSVHMLVANGIQHICSTVTNGTQATFGDVIARNDMRTLKKTYAEFGSIMGLLNSIMAGTAIIMIVPFVSIYASGVTDVNYYAPLMATLVMTNAFLYHLKTPEGLLVISAGKYRESRFFVTAQALILAIGAVVGALLGGIEGMVVGVCASNIFAAAYLVFFVPDRITYTQRRETFKRYLVTILAFAPAAIISLTQLEPIPDNWMVWIVEAVITGCCMLVWSLSVFLVFEKEPTLGVLARMRSMIGLKK